MNVAKTAAYRTVLSAIFIIAFITVCGADETQDSTAEAVIGQTNQERAERHIPVLEGNRALNTIAHKRLADMLEKRYFAHTSPSGEDVADIAESFHYDYSCIGENLARGNFKNADDLVGFWMKSPQHRKNLLSRDYKDIGVAISRESVGGRDFWHAIQVFGRRTRPKASP